MGRLSQKDLVNRRMYEEGIGSMLKKAAQTGIERAVKTGKALGTAMAPKTSEALGKIGKAISSDFVKVLGANPKNGLRSWLGTPEGSRLFKNVTLGKENKLENNDVEISFEGKYIDPKTPDIAKDISGIFSVRPEGEGSWGVMGAKDNEGAPIWAPSKRETGRARGGGKVGGGDDPLTGGVKGSPIPDDKTNRILEILKAGVERLPKAAEASYNALRRLAIDGYKTGKYAANEIVSAADGFLTAVDEFQQGYDEGSGEEPEQPVEPEPEQPVAPEQPGEVGQAGQPGAPGEAGHEGQTGQTGGRGREGEIGARGETGREGAPDVGTAGEFGLTPDDEPEQPEKPVEEFKPEPGQTVLVRTKNNPAGEPGVVKQINPSGGITVATAGNKTGYAFNPKNVLPDPRIKNENSSQKELLRQLTLLSN